jgi:hypothetical protein
MERMTFALPPSMECSRISSGSPFGETPTRLSSVGNIDPSGVEMKGFKVTHVGRGRWVAGFPGNGTMCGLYGEHIPGPLVDDQHSPVVRKILGSPYDGLVVVVEHDLAATSGLVGMAMAPCPPEYGDGFLPRSVVLYR